MTTKNKLPLYAPLCSFSLRCVNFFLFKFCYGLANKLSILRFDPALQNYFSTSGISIKEIWIKTSNIKYAESMCGVVLSICDKNNNCCQTSKKGRGLDRPGFEVQILIIVETAFRKWPALRHNWHIQCSSPWRHSTARWNVWRLCRGDQIPTNWRPF